MLLAPIINRRSGFTDVCEAQIVYKWNRWKGLDRYPTSGTHIHTHIHNQGHKHTYRRSSRTKCAQARSFSWKWIHTCAREYVCVLCLGRGCSEVKLVLLKVFPAEINHSGPGCIIAAINHWAWPLFPLSCDISEERWGARLLSVWWLPQMVCALHIFQSACISSQVNMEMAIASRS